MASALVASPTLIRKTAALAAQTFALEGWPQELVSWLGYDCRAWRAGPESRVLVHVSHAGKQHQSCFFFDNDTLLHELQLPYKVRFTSCNLLQHMKGRVNEDERSGCFFLCVS